MVPFKLISAPCVSVAVPSRPAASISFSLPLPFPRSRSHMCHPEGLQSSAGNRHLHVCRAHPRRVAKVAKQIEREVGSILLADKVILDVTRPDAATKGTAVETMVSCTGVEVTNDLQVVKVYVSVYTDDTSAKETILSRLNGLAGYVRSRVGERVRLRLTPEVRFLNDESFVRGERVLRLLELASRERDGSGGAATRTEARGEDPDEFEDDDDDDDDDDGFFVLNDEEGDELVTDGNSTDLDQPSSAGMGEEGAARGGASVPGGAAASKSKVNRFLVGLEDDSDEEDDEDEETERRFFTADMFPDAKPELEALQAKQKALLWKDKQKKAAKGRGRR